jgi:hypothetical protein
VVFALSFFSLFAKLDIGALVNPSTKIDVTVTEPKMDMAEIVKIRNQMKSAYKPNPE